MGRTRNQIIDEVTSAYMKQLNQSSLPSPEDISITLINLIETELSLENQVRPARSHFRYPESLTFDQIAELMAFMYPIVRISCAGSNADPDYDLLALYCEDGINAGVYVTSDEEIYKLAIRFNKRLTSLEFEELIRRLRVLVPRRTRCMDRDLIAVNNGIFNYETKQLMPFTPDLVFTTKSHVNYNPNAKNITIHNDTDNTDWDVESWMSSLSDDPEIVDLLWEVLGAIIRPHVRWNKSAWLYSETGNNGKGTLCELMRSLCGDTAYAAIPLCDFSKDFVLEPLTRSTAIIVDENDVGLYLDRVANLKAVITNDVIPINRKFKTPISYQFYGFMVQCLNEFPRIKDKSDSFYRRQLFIPFEKCFTGKERKYIKNDYLHRDEVLEYVMCKVLNMNYYTLSEPDSCMSVLQEYKAYNDPVRQFMAEFEDVFVWDLLPFTFLYELYKAWFKKNSPTGTLQGKVKFINDIVSITKGSDKWCCHDKAKTVRVGTKMSKPEPLIATYDLAEWKNPTYTGGDLAKVCTPNCSGYYRGLVRVNTQSSSTANDGGDSDK